MKVFLSAVFAVTLISLSAADARGAGWCPNPGNCAHLGCGTATCWCKEVRLGNFECWGSNESEPGPGEP